MIGSCVVQSVGWACDYVFGLMVDAWLRHHLQELIRRRDSERELSRSAPGSYPNLLK